MILTMTGERRNDPMNVASENVVFATTTDKACDDSIEIISDGELSSDHEDGEISEGLSDIFSDDSQDDLAMTSSHQSPDPKSGKSGGNPAHPLVSKVREGKGEGSSGSSQGNVTPGRDDDQDEDVLYLRLMAMRSILNEAVSSPKETDESEELADESEVLADESDEMVNEMAELLDEVDQAADGESQEPLDQSPMDIAAVIEKMQKCKNATKKQNVDEEEEELFIPTFDLDVTRSPIGVEEPDDEVTIVGEVSGRIKVSEFSRLVPRRDLFAANHDDDVQIIEEERPNCEPVDMEISCENEAEIQFFKDQADPEKQKDAPFPPSVWQIGALLNQPPPPPPPLPEAPSPSGSLMSNVMNFDNDEARYNAFLKAVFAKSASGSNSPNAQKLPEMRKRRKSEETRKDSKLVVSTSPATKKARTDETKKTTTTNNVVDEAESLRANILISMIEKRKRKEKEILKTKPVSRPTSSVSSKTNSECQKLTDQVIKMRHFPNLFKQVVISTAASDDDEDHDGHRSSVTPNPIVANPDFSLNLENFLKGVRQETTKKRTTPPPKPARKNPPGKINKNVSNRVKPGAPQVKKLSSPSSKSSLSVAVKTDLMTSTVSHLPLAKQAEYKRLKELIANKERVKLLQKQTLMAAKKSAEQQKLVVIKAKSDEVSTRETEEKKIGRADEPLKNTKTNSETTMTSSDEKTKSDDEEEDEEMLRSKLLASLQVKKKQDSATLANEKPASPGLPVAKPPRAVVRKRITAPAKTLSSIPVIIKKQTQPLASPVKIIPLAEPPPAAVPSNVAAAAVSAPVSEEDVAAKELLKKKEEALAAMQRDMMQEIFKLSAQMSQLKGETKNLDEARSFADDLRQQLAETELIIERTNVRIDQLRTTVKSSIVDIGVRRPAMVRMEDECKKFGGEIVGPAYKPPQAAGSQNIKKKLALIKTNAETLLETDNNNPSPDKTENEAEKEVSNEETTLNDEGVNSNHLQLEESCKAAATTTTTEAATTSTMSEAASSTTTTAEAAAITTKAASLPTAKAAASTTAKTVASTTNGNELVSSSLAHLHSSLAPLLDPHTQLCRFELQGKCNDDQCPFQHHTPKDKPLERH